MIDVTTCDHYGHWDVEDIKRLCEYRDQLRAALDSISTLLTGTLTGSTHWSGCEAIHPLCAIGSIVEDTLRPEPQSGLPSEIVK